MNIQIRVQVPKGANAKSYDTDTDVAVITDPEVVRDVMTAILKAEARIAAGQKPGTQTVTPLAPEPF